MILYQPVMEMFFQHQCYREFLTPQHPDLKIMEYNHFNIKDFSNEFEILDKIHKIHSALSFRKKSQTPPTPLHPSTPSRFLTLIHQPSNPTVESFSQNDSDIHNPLGYYPSTSDDRPLHPTTLLPLGYP